MPDRNTLNKYTRAAIDVVQKQGVKAFTVKALNKIAKTLDQPGVRVENTVSKIKFNSIVDRRDVMLADWSKTATDELKISQPKRVINWIISPPSSGGGHQNMFRFIEYLDQNGFTNNVYLYSTHDPMTLRQAEKNVSDYANLNHTHFFNYDRTKKLAPADAIFATGWETAYPVLNEKTKAKKFYFVQDFEPLFYAMGTEYILAENTYKFGFHGITAGGWLAKKLKSDYSMKCNSYEFGADGELYKFTNTKARKEVFFYARPVTERRAFDLGIMTLEIFHKKHPEYIINLAGWDVSGYEINFPYVNHKSLKLDELCDLYNRCATGLVLSLTNMSLLPLELLASGVIPVVNQGENNTLVSDNPYIRYTHPSPLELAQEMSAVVSKHKLPHFAKEAADSVKDNSWKNAKKEFMNVLEVELYG